MHIPALFMEKKFPEEKYLSSSKNVEAIKTYLRGKNDRITSLVTFRKTTPPTEKSQFFVLKDYHNPMYQFAEDVGKLFLMVV